MSYDPKLRLLAIGTKQGRLNIYGQPGVELTGEIDTDATINQLFFIRDEVIMSFNSLGYCCDSSM